ncbi:MAG TPA: nucleotide exchange factor GrpE [Gemmatimonadaceae bacterium]|nr:nucleotide exchange factor GrpE [Gemmatimonadaceae bacterium]
MRDKVNAKREDAAREQMERNDEVAASAEPQGDGVPDDADDGMNELPAGAGAAAGRAGIDVAAEAERALAEQRDRFLRLAAEYDNYRKRTARERLETTARAQGELVKRILDSLDDLGRVLTLDPEKTDARSVIDGVGLVEKKLLKALASAGLEIVNPVDQAFNPELHEAIATQPALSPEDDNMVAQVYEVGYSFGGQLLRPARVVVKQWNE